MCLGWLQLFREHISQICHLQHLGGFTVLKASLPQCHSVGFLQRLQRYYTLPGRSDSQNQSGIPKPSPWDSRFQSQHPIHNADKFCCQLMMHVGHLVPHYQRPMFVLLLEQSSGFLISQGGRVAGQSFPCPCFRAEQYDAPSWY